MATLGDNPYYFRDCCLSAPMPHRAFAASAVWHITFVLLILPLARYIPVPAKVTLPRIEITWYGPINDLPLIAPRAPAAQHRAARKLEKAQTQPGADAFHPRQTIVNTPMRPNHLRQTLIQPADPLVPPTILPNLPNIAEWNTTSQPKRPEDAEMLAIKRPKAASPAQTKETALPNLPQLEQKLGPIDLIASADKKPALPIEPMQAPRARQRQTFDAKMPDALTGQMENTQLIALSATPEPERPLEIPAGNLSARLAISPEGTTPVAPTAGRLSRAGCR